MEPLGSMRIGGLGLFALVSSSLLAAALGLGAAGSAGCGPEGGTGGGGAASSASGGTGGSGAGGGTGGSAEPCFDYTDYDGTAPAVHFAADVLPIFRTSCGLSTSCHGSEIPPAPEQHFLGPKNSAGEVTPAQVQAIFDQVVNQPSVVNPDMLIIKPGDPESSFLMFKLDGLECPTLTCLTTHSCGSNMPPSATHKIFPADKRDVVRRWIAQGAKND